MKIETMFDCNSEVYFRDENNVIVKGLIQEMDISIRSTNSIEIEYLVLQIIQDEVHISDPLVKPYIKSSDEIFSTKKSLLDFEVKFDSSLNNLNMQEVANG